MPVQEAMTAAPKPLREPRTIRQSLRRTRMTPWRRPEADKVSPELRMQVFERDSFRCVAPLLAAQHDAPIDPCKGQYGQRAIVIVTTEGPIYDLSVLTYEHVIEHPGIGQGRGEPRLERAATLCFHHNVGGWAGAHKRWLRAYLADLYGAVAT